MTLKHPLTTSLTGLRTHRLRSSLTILGIVIGITAIMLVLSLGAGAQNLILEQIQGIGSKTIAVIPGREPKGPSDAAQIFSDSLRERDLDALKRKSNVPTLARIMPIVFGGESAAAGSETYRLTVFGATEQIGDIFGLMPEAGAFFTDADVRARGDVTVIGAKVREELFGNEPALGEKLRIKGKNFRVIGVLPKKGQASFFNFDEAAIVPYTTAQHYLFGIKYFHRLLIEAETEAEIVQTALDVAATLRSTHRITDPDKDDFFLQTQADLAKRVGTVTTALTLFLVAVASISLAVGGIGIMNIMLVSVTERTKEIGLRKAVGATNRDILMQFLFEAMMLTGLGGALGILLGSILAFGVSRAIARFAALAWPFSFPYLGALLGLLVSVIVGLVFGLYPARRASQMSPVDALRHE